MSEQKQPGWWSTHLEFVATVVLSASAILTGWSAFQASQWNTEVSQANNRVSAARVESTRYEILAGQDRAVDISVFTSFLDAFNADMRQGLVELVPGVPFEPTEGTLSGFIYNRVRAEFRPAFEAWVQAFSTDRDSAPPNPFVMDEYHLANADRAAELLDSVQVHSETAQSASANSSNYLLTTLVFAMVIFFGGISSKLERTMSKKLAVSIAALLFVAGAVIVIAQPRIPVW